MRIVPWSVVRANAMGSPCFRYLQTRCVCSGYAVEDCVAARSRFIASYEDGGELEDLYRVASLVGLALSLIVVSLIYQRFVFRTSPEDAA